jgi:CheY-like chemotaxis protein
MKIWMNEQREKYILLVDDNTMDLRSIYQLLVHLGYKVSATTNPHDALSLFCDDPERFDVIITDQIMPGMRGHELASHIREIRKDIPIIVCSGSEGALQELQKQRTDIHEFILKPFSKSELTDAIARVLV